MTELTAAALVLTVLLLIYLPSIPSAMRRRQLQRKWMREYRRKYRKR
jgi:hypothetical protein